MISLHEILKRQDYRDREQICGCQRLGVGGMNDYKK